MQVEEVKFKMFKWVMVHLNHSLLVFIFLIIFLHTVLYTQIQLFSLMAHKLVNFGYLVGKILKVQQVLYWQSYQGMIKVPFKLQQDLVTLLLSTLIKLFHLLLVKQSRLLLILKSLYVLLLMNLVQYILLLHQLL